MRGFYRSLGFECHGGKPRGGERRAVVGAAVNSTRDGYGHPL